MYICLIYRLDLELYKQNMLILLKSEKYSVQKISENIKWEETILKIWKIYLRDK